MDTIGNWSNGGGGVVYEGSHEEWVQVTDNISLSYHLFASKVIADASPGNAQVLELMQAKANRITLSEANRFWVGGRTWDLWEWDPEVDAISAEGDLSLIRSHLQRSDVSALLHNQPASPHAVPFEPEEPPSDWRGWVKEMVALKKAPRRALRAYDKLATHKPQQEAAETVLRNVEPGFDRLWPGHPIGGTRMP